MIFILKPFLFWYKIWSDWEESEKWILKIAIRIYSESKYFITTSVTRLDTLLHFGQLLKACGNKYFAQIVNIFRQFL